MTVDLALPWLSMHLGLAQLVDPRLRLLTDESRAFHENRATGRGPNSPEELRAIRAGLPEPAPASPPAVEELVAATDAASRYGSTLPRTR